MTADDHRRHHAVTSSDAPAIVEQLLGGCIECLEALASLPDPAGHLVELTRQAGLRGHGACPSDHEIADLRVLGGAWADLVDTAGHCARCDRCWRVFTCPATVSASEALIRAAGQRVAERIEAELVATLEARALARRRRRLRTTLMVALGGAAAAASLWTVLLTPPDPHAVLRDDLASRGATDASAGASPQQPRRDPSECVSDTQRVCPLPNLRGPCAIGVERCHGGAWSRCAATTQPSPERCDDGVDNDCDGEIDEGCSCRGDLTDLLEPADPSVFAVGSAVEFRWAPISCLTRDALFRVRDLTTREMVVSDVPAEGNSFRVVLATPRFVPGHTYRWTVRVIAPGAPDGEYAAQFRVFTVR